MLKGFKAFLSRGNVLDLAIAVIIGAAFNSVVKSLVEDILHLCWECWVVCPILAAGKLGR